MKALILDGSEGDEMAPLRDAAAELLSTRGHQVEAVALRDKNIAACTGCFGCWVRTPGECVIKDDGYAVARSFVTAEVLVLLTPIVFGGYSYQLKKALDRSICFALPFFQNLGGEMHHFRRYPDIEQRMVAIGRLSRPDEEQAKVFAELVRRNGRNFQPRALSSAVTLAGEDHETAVRTVRGALAQAGVAE